MINSNFKIAEEKNWMLEIKINFPEVRKSIFKSTMKQVGMKHLIDFGEWSMSNFDIEKFQSYYLFVIKAYQDNVLWEKNNQKDIAKINGMLIEYHFVSVDKSVIQNFCIWLKQLSSLLKFCQICIFDELIDDVDELEQWFNGAARYLEEKYHPCGTLGSEELLLCLNGTINLP